MPSIKPTNTGLVSALRRRKPDVPREIILKGAVIILNKRSKDSFRRVKGMMQDPGSIYDFIVKNDKGDDVNLGSFKGKVLLIVNVASKCGLTNSNYVELNQLYENHRSKGLEILAFPCNQFGDEEPGTNTEIKDFVCTRFKSEFPIFDKIEVNGENADPLYKYLKSGKWGMFKDDIQWNFAKFLVDKDGVIVHRYYPTTSPLTIEGDIKSLLEISQNINQI